MKRLVIISVAAISILLLAGCSTTTVEKAVHFQIPDITPLVSTDGDEYTEPEVETSTDTTQSTTAPDAASTSTSQTPSSSTTSSSNTSSSHTHNWVEQTENRWVVDQEAWTEWVPGKAYVLCSCGSTFSTQSAWDKHDEAIMINSGGKEGHSYSVQQKNEAVNHPEVGHYETVTIGYSCSCGATK